MRTLKDTFGRDVIVTDDIPKTDQAKGTPEMISTNNIEQIQRLRKAERAQVEEGKVDEVKK